MCISVQKTPEVGPRVRDGHSDPATPPPSLRALELRMFRKCCCTAAQRRVTQKKKKHQVLVVRNSPQTWTVLSSTRISPCDPPHPPTPQPHPLPPLPPRTPLSTPPLWVEWKYLFEPMNITVQRYFICLLYFELLVQCANLVFCFLFFLHLFTV